jgi:hypothetical protein
MKRFWLFVYNHYYPDGGMVDFKGDFDNEFDAMAFSKQPIEQADHNSGFSAHILDTKTRCVIKYDSIHDKWLNKAYPLSLYRESL